MSGKFRLKDSQVVSFPKKSIHLTNANLTDELAIEYLKAYPSNASVFVSIPDNWKELVNGNTKLELNIEGVSEDYLSANKGKFKEAFANVENVESTLIEQANKIADEKGLKRPHWKSTEKKLKQFIKANS